MFSSDSLETKKKESMNLTSCILQLNIRISLLFCFFSFKKSIKFEYSFIFKVNLIYDELTLQGLEQEATTQWTRKGGCGKGRQEGDTHRQEQTQSITLLPSAACQAVWREGRGLDEIWLMSATGWWRVCVPSHPWVTSTLNGFINL